MNLTHKRIAEIRTLVSAGIQLGLAEAEDLLGHNDHLTDLCEARARLALRAESESETLRSLYQMHKQTETREMRDLKAENAGLKTGYEAYERVNAELLAGLAWSENDSRDQAKEIAQLRAECEALRKDAERYRWLRDPDHLTEDFMDGPADNIVVGACGGEEILWDECLDDEIDKAMSKE